jgi:hypothetical protein
MLHLFAPNNTRSLRKDPLEEGSARRKDFYLTTDNIYKKQIATPPAGFEPAIPASVRPQTNKLNLAAAGIIWLLSLDVKRELSNTGS